MSKFYILFALNIIIVCVAIMLNIVLLRRTNIRQEMRDSRGIMPYGWKACIIVDVMIKSIIVAIILKGIIPMCKDLSSFKNENFTEISGFVTKNRRVFGDKPVIQILTVKNNTGEEKIAVYFNENIPEGTAQKVKRLPNSRFAFIEGDSELEKKLNEITNGLVK